MDSRPRSASNGMNLDAEIEAMLFYKNEPLSAKKMAAIVGRPEADVKEAITALELRLKNGGLVLISADGEYTLGTAPDAAAIIEKMVKDDLARDLGKASLDTLTIILYYGPVSKAQIDNIRGVNSGFMLRNLLIRGLISRDVNEKDQRSYLYKPTIELLSHLGITSINELPEWEELRRTLDKSFVEAEKNEGVDTEA